MGGNTFGTMFRLTTFGESHGAALGGTIDGCPSGIALTEEDIQRELDLRKPGQGGIAATARKEADAVRILSGVFEGKTTGTPIGFVIENTDQRSRDYSEIMHKWRPGHADFGFDQKFGFRDYRGGGRSSGRETVSRVAGGAIAMQLLATQGIAVRACTVELGGIAAHAYDPSAAQGRPYFAADDTIVAAWDERVTAVKNDGDTLGGIVQIEIVGLPAGLGEPVFDKLDAMLAHAFMSVGAVKGVEIGAGFEASRMLGSENNDQMDAGGFVSNNAGGILGGISNGMPVVARAAIKPIPSISKVQHTVTTSGEPCTMQVKGRHDICAIPRVVPVLKSMAALVAADLLLQQARQYASPLLSVVEPRGVDE
ncbi:MAG: chorismate synthase [Desulfovibrionales bacterium]|nr:chorismate synthase [Desulfovibrionales bacterium]